MIFKFIRRHLTGAAGEMTLWMREESSLRRIQPAPLLQTQNFRQKNITDFLVVSDCLLLLIYYTKIQVLTIVFISVNQQSNQLINGALMEKELLKLS